jgi:hypothetical protein
MNDLLVIPDNEGLRPQVTEFQYAVFFHLAEVWKRSRRK